MLLAFRLSLLAFLGAMMFANTGLPVVHLALGDKGMAFAFAYMIPGSIAVMTIGMWLPMRRISLSAILRSPIICAIVIGMGCMIFRTAPPAPIQNALLILGGASIPLMLLSLGYSLATLQLGDMRLGLLLAVAHYAVSAVSALIALQIMDLGGAARGTFLVEATMPVGVTVHIIAQRYGSVEEARTIASMVLFSTLMTIIIIPLVLEFWV